MKMDCDVIRDLLPLYTDGACGEKSRKLVEEHLQECADCREILQMLRNTEIETGLTQEKSTVIAHEAKRFRRRSAAVGAVIAGLFMIPVLVCLIVNLASGAALGWFFVVLSSLTVAASLVIVPLMVPENKALWTLCAFTVSLMLLLAVVCLYSRGRWFWIASGASLFGLSLIFLPFVLKARPVRKLIGNARKKLIIAGLDTALFVNMMNMITLRSGFTFSNVLFLLGTLAGIGMVAAEIIRNRGTEQ